MVRMIGQGRRATAWQQWLPAALALAMPAGAVAAQADPSTPAVSHPVVEPTGASAGKALNEALVQLARDPRSVDALLAAGDAAIALGDNDAALGFYTRADQLTATLAPARAGSVKVAIARARLHMDDPVEALHAFADAEQAGADPVGFAADRGLAFDLVGDNAAAIGQYARVLDHAADAGLRDDVTRRMALSQAIGGDRRAAERTLLPLLQRQDRAAWRIHTFVLAVTGRVDAAVAEAHATMPEDLAAAVTPYLRFMVRLTPAQQAAAANLGRYPRAADIGRDDPRIVAWAAAHPHPAVLAMATAAPAPVAAAPAASDDRSTHRKRRRGDPLAPPAPAPRPVFATAEPEVVLPAPPPPVVAMAMAPALVTTAPTPQPHGFDLAQAPSASSDAPAVAVAPVVPHPTVLSRLDLPPKPRPAPRPAPPVQQLTAPQPVPPAPEATAQAVVEPLPPAPPPAPAPKPAPPPPPAPEPKHPAKPVHKAADKPADKPADKEPAEKPATAHGKPAKGKAAEKAAKSGDEDAVPKPCPPAKGHHGKTDKTTRGKHAKAEPAHSSSRKGRHGHQAAPAEDDTCAPASRGDRPDGPAGVSRDSDSDDSAKTHGKTKGKAEKASEKGGRKARYASRIWVEVLTGADRDKMPAEWRKLVAKSHLLKKHKPYITPWRSNYRLLTGPFDSDADAQDFIAQLRKEGVAGFEWTSPAGQAVDSLPAS